MTQEPVDTHTLLLTHAGTIIEVNDDEVVAVVDAMQEDLVQIRRFERAEFNENFDESVCKVGATFIMIHTGHTMWDMDVLNDEDKETRRTYAENMAKIFLADEKERHTLQEDA